VLRAGWLAPLAIAACATGRGPDVIYLPTALDVVERMLAIARVGPDLAPASVVALYLSPALNLRLRPKLFRELRPGTRIVSNSFEMGDWRPDSAVRVRWPAGTTSTVNYWVLPADLAGTWRLTVAGIGPDRHYRVRFEQRFQEVTGTASAAGRTVQVAGLRLTGDRVEFTLADTLDGRTVPIRLQGVVSGSVAEGTATSPGADARGTWRAARP
jgi:hypothetical protein